jgi:hypothetical protein
LPFPTVNIHIHNVYYHVYTHKIKIIITYMLDIHFCITVRDYVKYIQFTAVQINRLTVIMSD